jgi:Flp pilus assembly secretin CpaC
MKPSFWFLALLFMTQAACAEEAPVNLQITADFLQVDPATAVELTVGAKAPANATECRAALLKLLSDTKTTSLASVSVTTKSGQRATAESNQELVYPTEFNPAEGRAAHSPSVPATQSGVDVPTPTAFEMKPVGARVEVDPVISPDGKIIDLNIAPELTRHFGNIPQQKLKTAEGEQATMESPNIYSLKTQTAISLTDGGSGLAAVLLPPDEEGNADSTRRVLIFVSVRVLR